MTKELRDIHFDALRNAIYHSSRRGFLDTMNRLTSFVIIMAGTTAVADLGLTIWGFVISVKILAAIAALLAALQLVFDFGGLARTHEFLQCRYYDLIAEITSTPNPVDEDIQKWKATLARIYSTEPPPLRALDSISYNAAMQSMGGFEHPRQIKVTFWQNLLRNIYSFPGSEFPLLSPTQESPRQP